MAKRGIDAIKSDIRAAIFPALDTGSVTVRAHGISADRLANKIHIIRGERPSFIIALSQMERDGELRRSGGKGNARYAFSGDNAISAVITSLSAGFAFARMDADGQDCFIPGSALGGALPGDKVLIITSPEDTRGIRGRVLRIIQQGGRCFSGRVTETGHGGLAVAPDALIRFSLPVRKSKTCAAKVNDKVRFSVYESEDGQLYAQILTGYGSANSARACADAIIDTAGIPSEFSAEALEQAEKCAAASIEPEFGTRVDFRGMTIFTIDGADAKDLDDAISLERVGSGYKLGVHIADVSHYVRDHTPLGNEAALRGTSVYFADRVIPMLPEALSNDACSLNAGQDKLTLSAVMTIDSNGKTTSLEIKKSVIHSVVRGVYSEVNAILDGSADSCILEKYKAVTGILFDMRELAGKLRSAAEARGAVELNSVESRFILDEQGHPIDIRPRVTGESEGIIEQFMICANVSVAAFARANGLPFVYRIHENPSPDKLLALCETAGRLGFRETRIAERDDLRRLVNEARSTPYSRLISDRILRAMAKARYSPSPAGHYGLSLADYCHFTSPIRRFPDLLIHRILSAFTGGMSRGDISRKYDKFVQESANTSSLCEVRAMTAERDCEDCYKAEYMSRFIGDEFDGVICTVAPFGIFVELENSIDGLIRLEDLPEEGLVYDDAAALVNARGKPLYTVGDCIRIRVDGTDVSSGRVDFAFVKANTTH